MQIEIYSKDNVYQAIIGGTYYRAVDFGKGPQWIEDTGFYSDPLDAPSQIARRVEGCNYHTLIGLRQINPRAADELEKIIEEREAREYDDHLSEIFDEMTDQAD